MSDMSDGADPKSPYVKETFPLAASHRWKAAPGYNILVADAGAVRFEYPHGWVVRPQPNGNLQVHDREPPADECRITMTVFRLPPLGKGASWEDLPLDQLMHSITVERARKKQRKKDRGRKQLSDAVLVKRPDLSYAWCESSWPDPENGRTVFCRQVLARARGVQPLITFDYYASRADDFRPVWEHLVASLRLGSPVNLLGDSTN
jgi:hypothetical protein